jgi:hypothetical protein
MLEDLMPFFFMVAGMIGVGVTLLVVTIKQSMDLPKEYRTPRFREDDHQRQDPETSAGRGSGFQG